MQITIQPITTGTNGIYKANAINVVPRPSDITDTTIVADCYLVNLITGGSVGMPDAFGLFTVTLNYPLNQSRASLQPGWITQILTTPSTAFVIR